MTTALVRRCDECRDVIAAGTPMFVLSRFHLHRAPGVPVVIDEAAPVDLCSISCYTALVMRLFHAASRAGTDQPAPEPARR